MFDGPNTASTMCQTGTPKQTFKDLSDMTPMRNFFDSDVQMSPRSPVARKRFNDEDMFLNAPSKKWEQDRSYDMSPCEFDLSLALFDTEPEMLRTPEKRPKLLECQAPTKPKLQLRYSDVEPMDFDLSKKLFADEY